MKIARVELEGFRRFRDRTVFDLTDELGRPRDLVALTGLNGCGKTSLLDAIALALQPSYQLPCVRPGLVLSPRSIVNRTALKARVIVDLQFTPTEVDTVCELLDRLEKNWLKPTEGQLRLTWTYPGDKNSPSNRDVGWTEFEPGSAGVLMYGRKLATEALSVKRGSPDLFERLGGVFTFDQERPSLGMRIPENLKRFLYPTGEVVTDLPEFSDETDAVLLGLAIKGLVKKGGVPDQRFEQILDLFRRMVPGIECDLEQSENGDIGLVFREGSSEFDFTGLSSGQKSILYFLVHAVEKRIHQSVLLVDEPELHLEEPMQRRLLNALQTLGNDNQIILTTHSSYLARVIPAQALIAVGDDTPSEVVGVTGDA
jgi:energy-coupling factor transporter ATP-binding protein EcfA2